MAQLDLSSLTPFTPGTDVTPAQNVPPVSAPGQLDTSSLSTPEDYAANKQAQQNQPEPNRWQQLGGALLKGIPAAISGMGEAMERGERMGMMPGMDLIAGMLQPAVAPLTGQPVVPTPVTTEANKDIGKIASAAHVNPWDYFPDPGDDDPLGQIINATGESATGMLVPFGGEGGAEGGLLAKGLARLGNVAKQMTAGAVSGAAGQTAATFAPDQYKPAASLVGGLLGGVGGNLVAEAPGIVGRSLQSAGDYMAPISRGNTQKLAAARIAPYVTDIGAAQDNLSQPGEIVPGDMPTAAEQSGDLGLTMFQRSLARTDPEFRQQLLQRTDQQNAARTQFLEDLQREGAPSAVADSFRGQMDQLTQRADQLYDQAQQGAQQQFDQLGNPLPQQVGEQARTAMQSNFKALNAQANALYDSIPDDLHTTTGPLLQGTAQLYGQMTPEEQLTLLPSEQALAGVIGNYGPTVPFQRLRQLTSAINTAMREARQAPNGGQAYGRLTQLRGLIDDTMDASIADRVAQEQAEVANGNMAPQDTLAARFLNRAEEFNGPGTQTATGTAGNGLDTGNAVPTSEQASVLSGTTGTGSDLGRGFAGPEGNQGLPQDAGEQVAPGSPVANTVAERFAAAGRPMPEARALGALTDAFAKTMGVPEDQVPEVQRATTAPSGALYQQGEHPAIQLMREHPNDPRSAILREAYSRDPNPDHIPLTIDNDRALYDATRQHLQATGMSPPVAELAESSPGAALLYQIRQDQDQAAANAAASANARPTAPTFYSAAERAVSASKTTKANADQWLATLKNTPGIKQEELDWIGLPSWLREQQRPVTREELAQFIRDNSLQVDETDLSGNPLDQEFDRIEWQSVEPDDDYLRENIYPGSWSHDKAKEDIAQERNDNPDYDGTQLRPDDIADDDEEVMDKALAYERDSYNEEPEYTATLDYGGISFHLTRDRYGDDTQIWDATNGREVPSSRVRDDADIQSAIQNYMADNGYGDGEGGDGSTKYHEYAEHGGEDYHELLLTLPERSDMEYTRPSAEVRAKYKPQWDALVKQIADAGAKLRGEPFELGPSRAAYNQLMDQQDALHRQMVQETINSQPPWARGQNFTRSHWDEPNVVAHVRFDTRTVGGKRTLFLQEIQSDWHQQGRERGYAGDNMEEKRAKAEEELNAAKKDWNDVLAEHVEKHKPAGTLASDFMDMGEPSAYKIKRALRNQYADAVTYWKDRQEDPAARQAVIDAENAQTAHEKAINALYESEQFHKLRAAQSAHERLDPYHVVPDAPFKTTWPELTLKRMIRWAAEKGYDQIAWAPGDLQNGSIVTHEVKSLYHKKAGPDMPDRHYVGESSYDARPMTVDEIRAAYGSEAADKVAAGEGGQSNHYISAAGPAKVINLANPIRVGGDIQYYYGKVLPGIASKLVKKFGSDVYRTPMNIAGERINAVTIPINDKMRETALHEGQPLFQGGERGAIQFGPNGKTLLSLLKNADASTGLHELAHWFLQNYGQLANDPKAPAFIKGDWQTTKAWWRKNADAVANDAGGGTTADHVRQVLDSGTTGDAARDDQVHRGLHEQWARAFEQYAAEGKAPTPGLQPIFDRFKQWMGQVYRSLRGLNVQLSPEMRGVFDRMLGGEAPTETAKMLDAAARQRYREASAATKNIKETFGGKGNPVGPMLKRAGSTYAYDMSDESLAGKLWRPGAEGVNTINRVMKAAGDAQEVRASIEQAAVMSLKNSATAKDGVTLDPNKFAAWRAKHAEALQAMPGLDARLQTVADASKTMQRVADARKRSIDMVQKSAVGKLLGLRSDADVTATVGSMLNGKNAVGQMRELVASAKADPAAMDGLRKAVVDHMMGKLKSNTNTGGFKNATFQKYLGDHAAALSEVLSPEQMNGLRAVAQTIKRASKDTRAPGGGSDTAQNLNDQAHFGGHRTLLGLLLEKAGEVAVRAGVSLGIGHLMSPLAGLGAWLAESTINSARQAGLKRVDDLVRTAILNPEVMADLLKKAPKQKGTGSEVNLARTLGKLAFTAGNMAQRQP